MPEAAAPEPQFDDTRKALVFALNEGTVAMPRPVMNKAMTDAARRKQVKKKKKKPRGANAEAERALEERLANIMRRSTPVGPRPLQGLDRPHQAGFVLQQFALLEERYQIILRGRCLRSYDPCSCRSACCSGRRQNPKWSDAVFRTCLLLQGAGDVLRQPGKRGLSTQPQMRSAIVRDYYLDAESTLVELAGIGDVSLVTAAKHREWIYEFLRQTENEAWQQLDNLFDQAGITGSFDEAYASPTKEKRA